MNEQSRQHPVENRFLLAVGCGLPAAFLGVVIGLAWFVRSEWVPQSKINRLPGASMIEVEEILGPPTAISRGEGSERWCYRSSFYWAEFQVDFDAAGRVEIWGYDW
jgi:hypothetical protein